MRTHHVEQLQSPPGHADTREGMDDLLGFLLADVDRVNQHHGHDDLNFPLSVVEWAAENRYALEDYACEFDNVE